MMMEGGGFEVVDLGANVSTEKFVEAVRTHKPAFIGMSALLTTTMPEMKKTILALEKADLRKDVRVIIGGAPVTDRFAGDIGADGFASDGTSVVAMMKSLLKKPKAFARAADRSPLVGRGGPFGHAHHPPREFFGSRTGRSISKTAR